VNTEPHGIRWPVRLIFFLPHSVLFQPYDRIKRCYHQPQHFTFHLWPVHVSWWSASLFVSFWELFNLNLLGSLLFHYGSLFCWSLLSCFTWLPCIDHPQNGDDDQCYGREKAHNARRAVIFGNVGPHLQGSTWINVDHARRQLARRLWEFWDTLRKSLRNRSRRIIH